MARPDLAQRFAAQHIAVPESGCWLWTSYTDALGYGAIRVGGRKKAKAHRVSWELHNGPIPDGLLVCHKCDTPSCVNPSHLFLGTDADNCADKVRKGRASGGVSLGSRHGGAKLSEADVLAIRQSEGSQRAIAAAYGVAPATIGRILNRENWLHV